MMDARDYFAGLAMAEIIHANGDRLANDEIARAAYTMADAMMEARSYARGYKPPERVQLPSGNGDV